MSVIIGSARIDENGKAHGGKAGDQTGKELSTQTWYRNSKGWVLLRPIDPVKAEKIARNMEKACANQNIGYDQYQRDTLYTVSKPLGFDCAEVKTKCETDCSALVRVCCAYAGIPISTSFRTTTEASVLMATGQFEKFTDSDHTNKSDYLRRGDILVTKTQGHTVVVLSDGSKSDKTYKLGERTLIKGLKGPDVKEMQTLLLKLKYDLGKYGTDGDFGSTTLSVVKKFQTAAEMVVDGIMDASDIQVLKNIVANGWKPQERVLSIGMSGTDVQKMQSILLLLKYDLGKWGADGEFGDTTLAAVRKFQADAHLIVDGTMDATDMLVLKAISEKGWPITPPPSTPPEAKKDYLCDWVVATEDCDVFYGPGTQYKKWSAPLLKGTGLVYDGETKDGWYSVWLYGSRKWVSSKYSKIEIREKPIVDISKYDSVSDWPTFLDQISYGWIRVGARAIRSNGPLVKDSKFDKQASEFTKYGKPFGVYFFGRAKTIAGAIEEAKTVLNWIGKFKPTTVSYDIETPTNTQEASQAFIDTIEAAGITCGIYVGRKWSQVHADKLRTAFRWGPYYRKNTGGMHGRNPTNTYDFHQYACAYKFRGKSDPGDVSHVHGPLSIEWLRSGGKES